MLPVIEDLLDLLVWLVLVEPCVLVFRPTELYGLDLLRYYWQNSPMNFGGVQELCSWGILVPWQLDEIQLYSWAISRKMLLAPTSVLLGRKNNLRRTQNCQSRALYLGRINSIVFFSRSVLLLSSFSTVGRWPSFPSIFVSVFFLLLVYKFLQTRDCVYQLSIKC